MEPVTKQEHEDLQEAGQSLSKVTELLRYKDGLDEYASDAVLDSISRLTEFYEGYHAGTNGDDPDPYLAECSSAYDEGYETGSEGSEDE